MDRQSIDELLDDGIDEQEICIVIVQNTITDQLNLAYNVDKVTALNLLKFVLNKLQD
jgi:hypothetical protein